MSKPLPFELERIRQECSQDLHNGLLAIDMDIRAQLQYQAQGGFKPVTPFNYGAICSCIQQEIEGVQKKMQKKVERFAQANGPKTHTVRRGEILGRIKDQYGVRLDQLLRINPQISNPDDIKVGQKILIPGKVNLGKKPVVMALEV
ncbi:LysM peptidoglycan-binding domain-containing protein, partial [Xanthovirga aplysinae]|uniref:LysM peptidoglycan-binding domain-containing protein n=1 Tax=Xanthovirga aplysinae TaxID=2529853 RepID=UPI0012BCB409